MKTKKTKCYRCEKKNVETTKVTMFRPEDFVRFRADLCRDCYEIVTVLVGGASEMETPVFVMSYQMFANVDKKIKKILPDFIKRLEKWL
jgi:hypothetical protein